MAEEPVVPVSEVHPARAVAATAKAAHKAVRIRMSRPCRATRYKTYGREPGTPFFRRESGLRRGRAAPQPKGHNAPPVPEPRMPLTLVPAHLARAGQGFTFRQAKADECQGCPYARLCLGLEMGHRYEVRKLRGVTHPCALHEGGKVHVVEAEEAPFAASLEARHLRG